MPCHVSFVFLEACGSGLRGLSSFFFLHEGPGVTSRSKLQADSKASMGQTHTHTHTHTHQLGTLLKTNAATLLKTNAVTH
jgi:hypothetical protein